MEMINLVSDIDILETSMEFKKFKNELKARRVIIYISIILTNVLAFATLIGLIVLIYNLISIEDSIDINRQLKNINKISHASDSIIADNKYIMERATAIINEIIVILNNICLVEPILCNNTLISNQTYHSYL